MLFTALIVLAVLPPLRGEEPRDPGNCVVVVDSARNAGGAERAGLRAGDLLLTWKRTSETGAILSTGVLESPFDVQAVETDELARGPITLEGWV